MAEILIVGTGAMALLFGGRLAASGVKVTLLGTWNEGIQAVREKGIRITGETGEFAYPVKATSDIREIKKVPFALVLVKSWQTERAAQQLKKVMQPDSVALTMQNGLGNLEILSDLLGEDRAALGVTTYGATLLEPGLVRHGGEGIITLGTHPRLGTLKVYLQQADFSIQETTDLSSLVWSKLIINAAINPLTALLGVRNGELLESRAAKRVMSIAAKEAASIASAKGIKLNFKDPARAAEEVAAATAGNISSMLQDIRRKSPTEIDAICGEIVREGKRLKVSTPVNNLLFQLVQSQVDLSRKNYENS
ncbi:MAG: 2-dehydropantoate 2-reductase [Anaerolineales bacterium]